MCVCECGVRRWGGSWHAFVGVGLIAARSEQEAWEEELGEASRKLRREIGVFYRAAPLR